mmetsp:Transcript_24235/g.50106  ORF Transcript_24235/g.50106 Transcript_24235/m.50106 type:complete len:240 (+) Transcript_24235:233-952(+)
MIDENNSRNSSLQSFRQCNATAAMPASDSCKKRRQGASATSSLKSKPKSTKATVPVRNAEASSSIPLPKSHIHRTPSELQLADDMRTAEYQDVRMYARLVVGMQSQCLASGYVHPLSRKSLQGVIQTKQANIDEGAMNNHEGTRYSDYDHGWDVSYIDEENSMGGGSPAQQQLKNCEVGVAQGGTFSAQGGGFLQGHSNESSSLARHSSDGSVSTLSHQGHEFNHDNEDEDDCVFCLEL